MKVDCDGSVPPLQTLPESKRGGVVPWTPWYCTPAGAAALSAHAPLLRLKSEDFFRAPEEEVQRVFDFLGLERADISLEAYEEATVKMFVAAPPPPLRKGAGSRGGGESGVAAEWRAITELY